MRRSEDGRGAAQGARTVREPGRRQQGQMKSALTTTSKMEDMFFGAVGKVCLTLD
jgi:hypothetical protein